MSIAHRCGVLRGFPQQSEAKRNAAGALMQVGFAALETRFDRRVGDLIKWSFVFWVGAVGAIAMLARALR